MSASRSVSLSAATLMVLTLAACRAAPPADRARVSGQVEATEVRIAAQVPGRLLELAVKEGSRVAAGDFLVRLDVADTELALRRAEADHAQAVAQWRLLQAGTRPQEIRQAEAQVRAAESAAGGAEVEFAASQVDVDRFEALLDANSGSRKQRDDARTRRDVARQRVEGAREQVKAAQEQVARLRAGARPEELEAARARIAAVDAQIATLQKTLADATVFSPVAGIVTETLAEPGEIIGARVPLIVITDLDRAWANVYVDEPDVPRIDLGQTATVFTDAGGSGIPGTVSAISERAEFTPRNVQTADERAKLVYRVKVSVDNRAGTLKSGMPVEAEIPFAR